MKSLIILICVLALVVSHPHIGGDDHDKRAQLNIILNGKSVEQLREYCIRLESYENSKEKGFLIGGLHDYINSMGKEECMQYIKKAVKKNKELLNVQTFSQIVEAPQPTEAFLADDTNEVIGGGQLSQISFKVTKLSDFLSTKSVEELRQYCVNVQTWEIKTFNTPLIGGIHDYVNKLDSEDCIKYLIGEAVKNKDLLELEFFTKTVTAQEDKIIGGGDVDKIAQQVTAVNEYLQTKTVEDLRSYCIRVENWIRVRSGEDKKKGGIHDSVRLMNKEKCIKWIVNKCVENKQLLDMETLKTAVEPVNGVIGGGNLAKTAHNVVVMTEALKQRSVDELRQYCLRIEDWERQNKQARIGGIHDYVFGWNNDDCIKYIINQCIVNKELFDMDFFQATIVDPANGGIIGGGSLANTSYKVVKLTELLQNNTVEVLREIALKVENWERTNGNYNLIGGIHDYVNRLNKDDCIKYIIGECVKNKELLEMDYFMKSIYSDKPVNDEPQHDTEKDNADWLYKSDRPSIEKYALACERYEAEQKHGQVIGGLNDFIIHISNENLINYINTKSDIYPELHSKDFISNLISKYGL